MSTVIGIDPGLRNFAYAVLGGRKKLLEVGWIRPYRHCADHWEIARSLHDVGRLIDRFHPDLVVCERYMYRGASSVHSELVNQILGAIMVLMDLKQIRFRFLTPAQWKNYATDQWGYDNTAKSKTKVIKVAKKLFPKIEVIHQLDAALMARYALEKKYVRDRDKHE